MNFEVIKFDTVGSTNDEALLRAADGAAEGLCVIARRQTAGRGRLGRTWLSPPDTGLYCSVVFRPTFPAQFLPHMTLMAGVAVHDSLQEIGIAPDIKWVNDILVGGRKIAGILSEANDNQHGLAVVVGIGINIRQPPELSNEKITSVESEIGQIDFQSVETNLLKFIDYFYATLCREDGPETIRREWRRRSSYFSGKAVRVAIAGEIIDGVTDGIEATGALRVRRTDGSVAIIQTGDVERLRAI